MMAKENKDYLKDIAKQDFNGGDGCLMLMDLFHLGEAKSSENLEKMIMVQTLCRECCLLKTCRFNNSNN